MAATRTTDYAVRALVALALEGEWKGETGFGPSTSFGHSWKVYGAGFTVAEAGWICNQSPWVGGGYELARPAEKIRMSEVVAWVDGGRNARGVARGDAVGRCGESCRVMRRVRRARYWRRRPWRASWRECVQSWRPREERRSIRSKGHGLPCPAFRFILQCYGLGKFLESMARCGGAYFHGW